MRYHLFVRLFALVASVSHQRIGKADEAQDAMAIRRAIRANDIQAVRQLLDRGANPNATGWNTAKRGAKPKTSIEFDELPEIRALGYLPPPLLYAVLYRRVEIAELLIKKGAIVNVKTPQGDVTLDFAAKGADMKMAKLLIDNGAEITAKALCYTLSGDPGYRGMAEMLIAAGAPVNGTASVPIVAAAKGYRPDMVKLLVEKGAKVNATDKNGDTALTAYACRSRRESVELVTFLIERGADVNAQNNRGVRALHRATKDPEIVRMLLEKGATPNVKNADGKTPLHRAVLNPESTQMLLEKGADVNAADKYGKTPLHQAKYCERCVQMLLEKGARVNVADEDGRTPLHEAVDVLSLESVKQLIKKKADVNAADSKGRTALHVVAATAGDKMPRKRLTAPPSTPRTKRELYERKLQQHQQREKRLQSTVHTANAIIELLLENGANVNARNQSGRTPLDVAHYGKVGDCLKDHGGKKGDPTSAPRTSSSSSSSSTNQPSGRGSSKSRSSWHSKKPTKPGEVTVILKTGANFTGKVIVETDAFIKIQAGPAEMMWMKNQIKEIIRAE